MEKNDQDQPILTLYIYCMSVLLSPLSLFKGKLHDEALHGTTAKHCLCHGGEALRFLSGSPPHRECQCREAGRCLLVVQDGQLMSLFPTVDKCSGNPSEFRGQPSWKHKKGLILWYRLCLPSQQDKTHARRRILYCNRYEYTHTHTREKFSWLLNLNAIRIHIRQKIAGNLTCIYSRAHGVEITALGSHSFSQIFSGTALSPQVCPMKGSPKHSQERLI